MGIGEGCGHAPPWVAASLRLNEMRETWLAATGVAQPWGRWGGEEEGEEKKKKRE